MAGYSALLLVLIACLAAPAFGNILYDLYSRANALYEGVTSPRKSSADSVNRPSIDTSFEGGNGDIFFPYKPKLSETDKVEMLERYHGTVAEAVAASYMSCPQNVFITVNGNVHQIDDHILDEEREPGYNEGVCLKVEMKVFFGDNGKGSLCYIQNEVKRREYNMLKDTYKDIHAVTKKQCSFKSKREAVNAVSADPKKWMSEVETEPEHFQNIVLVVYDCNSTYPLNSNDMDIWEDDGRTIKLKSDGTPEHVENLRNAGCRAVGSFAMKMYKNVPTATSTAILYNCPKNVDGFEKRVGETYVRKWRKDWKANNCHPTITKTQLDKDGNIQSITAKNFQSDKMTIEFATEFASAKQIPNVGKAILHKAQSLLEMFPKEYVNSEVIKVPSYVRRYFDY